MNIILQLFKHVGLKIGVYERDERVGTLKIIRDNRFGESIDPLRRLMINFNIVLSKAGH